MNYLEVILRGYLDENSRGYLEDYFIREYKKAEKEHFGADEFFEGCIKAINNVKQICVDRCGKAKSRLYSVLYNAENKEPKDEKIIELCKQELAAISEHNYPAVLFELSNKLPPGNLYYSEMLEIENRINAAHRKVSIPQQPESKIEKKTPVSFTMYLKHDKADLLAELLKNEFIAEKGKGLAILRKVLEETDPQILIIPDRESKRYFEAMKQYFGRDIGSFNGFKDFKYIEDKHKTEYQKTKQRVNNILAKLVNS